ncbi:MAG TPA: hypothetical protein VKT32_09610 [Chthonomonadaceae bacterium]|nr:hypothetical protein [Chthonomonadaceae bacterium]
MLSLFPFAQVAPRIFFLDMNAFFAAIEQQEKPHLRGRPMIVVPMLGTDYTCAIAASYEAKKLGIRTGTAVRLARGVTPDLQIVEARPELYLQYHARLVDILNHHFAATKVLSVDEMSCRIPALVRSPEQEAKLALAVKQQIGRELGPCLTCSIGIAPNVFLAKVAGDRQKPDGLTIWGEADLPEALFAVRLPDLPGIGPAMKRRLARLGITTVEELYAASSDQLRAAWNSVVGERWWYMLRGSHECDYQPPQAAQRKSVGHSHVLPPAWRTLAGAADILVQLAAKATRRLRAYQMAAAALDIRVEYRKARSSRACLWRRRSGRHLHANDDATWLKVLRPMLSALPDMGTDAPPQWVGIVFTDLLACKDVNLSLFEDPVAKSRLALTVDALNEKFGHVVDLLPIYEHYGQVPKRIPFGTPEEIPTSK